MKKTLTVLLLCGATVFAQAADKAGADKKKAAPAAHAVTVPPVTIPKDAVPNPDGVSYSYTDAEGKKWTYSRTPFGIIKSPVADAAPPVGAPAATKAIDKGETVRFERPGPFGTVSWEKQKSDLTDEERQMLDSQNAKTQ